MIKQILSIIFAFLLIVNVSALSLDKSIGDKLAEKDITQVTQGKTNCDKKVCYTEVKTIINNTEHKEVIVTTKQKITQKIRIYRPIDSMTKEDKASLSKEEIEFYSRPQRIYEYYIYVNKTDTELNTEIDNKINKNLDEKTSFVKPIIEEKTGVASEIGTITPVDDGKGLIDIIINFFGGIF